MRGIQAWKKVEGRVRSVEEIKARAEKYYEGISSKWIKHDASAEEAEAYKTSLLNAPQCSFCSRSMFEVDTLLESAAGACICNLCVTSFYEELIAKRPRG